VSCDDIGMRPDLSTNEAAFQQPAGTAASTFLDGWTSDPDLARDARSMIVLSEDDSGECRLWTSLGVRASRLKVGYAVPPVVRPAGEKDALWESDRSDYREYILLSDEFAQVTVPRRLTPKEFRAICNKHDNKDDTISALSGGGWFKSLWK
jgi:hypothetical protein